MEINKNCKNKIAFSIFLTSVLTFFLLWVFLAEPISNLYVKKVSKSDISLFNPNKQDLNLTKFWEVYSLLKRKYYSLDGIKQSDLVDWAIAGMVDAIWDKHSEFMNSKVAKNFNEALSWNFEWIWAYVEKTPIWVKIERVIKWSPAKKFWVKKNDIIIEANWVKLEDLDIWKAIEHIKWPAGSEVILKIIRPLEKEILDIKVIRARVKIPTIETKEFEDNKNIGYIALNMYWETSSKEFKNALKKMENKDWIIIDLRDNWWWYLISAVEILSNFIENWKVLVTVKWKSILNNTSYKSAWIWAKFNWKIVILINWNTASASEITAWALKDYNKAILIWTKSYWKGSVQEPYWFADWSEIKFTVAKWFTPNDLNIDKDGIEPDIKVEFKKEDYNFDECKKIGKCDNNMKKEDFEFFDRQLEKSKEILSDFIELGKIEKVLEKTNKVISK